MKLRKELKKLGWSYVPAWKVYKNNNYPEHYISPFPPQGTWLEFPNNTFKLFLNVNSLINYLQDLEVKIK